MYAVENHNLVQNYVICWMKSILKIQLVKNKILPSLNYREGSSLAVISEIRPVDHWSDWINIQR